MNYFKRATRHFTLLLIVVPPVDKKWYEHYCLCSLSGLCAHFFKKQVKKKRCNICFMQFVSFKKLLFAGYIIIKQCICLWLCEIYNSYQLIIKEINLCFSNVHVHTPWLHVLQLSSSYLKLSAFPSNVLFLIRSKQLSSKAKNKVIRT